MLALVISACLISNPGICKDFRVPHEGKMNAAQCMFQGQILISKWEEDHPSWNVKRWACNSNAENT